MGYIYAFVGLVLLVGGVGAIEFGNVTWISLTFAVLGFWSTMYGILKIVQTSEPEDDYYD